MTPTPVTPGPVTFPEAAYFIAASRLRPGLDGGYTVATLRRALDLARVGGVRPTILTIDFWPDYALETERFRELDLADESTVIVNLYDFFRREPQLLRDAAIPDGVPSSAVVSAEGLTETTDLDASGSPWRIVSADPTAATVHTDFLDASGARMLRLPYISGRADWHRADVAIGVFGADGELVGHLDGFGALYRLFVDTVVARSDAARAVVICEAKQLGELLVDGPRDYTLIHTVHNAHTLAPHDWDSPMDALWSGWLETIDRYDGVLWLSAAQKADAERRFGAHDNWAVVPHPAVPAAAFPDPAARDPHLVVMIARLVEQKRVDDAIRAWPAVLEADPLARLEIVGGGPLRADLDALVADLGLAESVTLAGYVHDAARRPATAAALVVTSRYEGQSLAVAEALSVGCPVVSYDIHYGPGEMIDDGRSGYLVAPGDIAALAASISKLVGHPDRIAEFSRAGWNWATAHDGTASMTLTADLVRTSIDRREGALR